MKHKILLKQNSLFLWLLLVPLMLAGCKKLQGEGKTVVEGKTVDKHTGQVVPNALVLLFSSNGKTFGGAYNTVELEKYSDSNGNFSFSFDAEDKSYVVRSFTELGYYTNWDDAVDIRGGRKNKDLKVKMRPPAWVKIKLVNTPPLDTLREISLWGYNSGVNGEIGTRLFNLVNDTSLIREVSGNEKRNIKWAFNNSGVQEKYMKEDYFPALDTIDVVIEY